MVNLTLSKTRPRRQWRGWRRRLAGLTKRKGGGGVEVPGGSRELGEAGDVGAFVEEASEAWQLLVGVGRGGC